MDEKELRTAVKAANKDIAERVREGGFKLQYDSTSDVFYFALTDYRPSEVVISIEDADPASTGYLRVEEGTWKVIGFDILAWREQHLKSNPHWKAAFTAIFMAVGTGDFKLEFDPVADDPLRLYYVPEQVEELLAAA